MNESSSHIQSNELESIKSSLSEIDSNFKLREVNLGEGADWILILAVLNGIGTAFLLGDKIEKGIEGWIKIGKRIKAIFPKADKVYMDKDAATFLAVEYLSEQSEIHSLKKVSEFVIPIKDLGLTFKDREQENFIPKPYCIYILTFEVNDYLQKTIGIRSDGEITEHYSFDKRDIIPF